MLSRYGLIGYPLSHSFSKKYFTDKFSTLKIDSLYELFPIESIADLPDLLNEHPDLKGLNVTIPYKRQIIDLLDDLSDEARKINAVNTVKISRVNNNLYLKGFNTDAPAFESELIDFTNNTKGNVLILGTGGASAAVSFVLEKLDWDFRFVSRKPSNEKSISYEALDDALIKKTKLIVNTTPVGMYPNLDNSPHIPYSALSGNHYLFDLVYNPELTEFLKKGQMQGAKIRNGLGMLYKQAELAWSIWQL